DEIARYIAANRLGRPAIVGHSMGGAIAMMIGARHPKVAGRVMVVDMLPAPARPFGVPPAAMKPLARLIGGEMAGADRLRRDLKSLVGRFGNSDWLESRNDAGVVGRSVSELLSTDLTPELTRIRAPLTIVFANRNARAEDYEVLRDIPRPGHADLVARIKFGSFNDARGGDPSGRIAGRRGAREAGDLDEVVAIARNGGDGAVPDAARGGEAGDQDHVGPAAAHRDRYPGRLERRGRGGGGEQRRGDDSEKQRATHEEKAKAAWLTNPRP
ncbi:MAG: chorismate synthase, partial [Allosphingosinicella sp.]